MKYCLAIFLFLTAISANAALIKWVDAEGKIHYSDSAPSDVKTKKLRSSSGPEASAPSADVPAQKSLAEREADWKKSQDAKNEAEKKVALEKENAAIKQKNCDAARGNLANYENSPRIVQYNTKGERTYLDETARAQQTEEARKAVSTYCN